MRPLCLRSGAAVCVLAVLIGGLMCQVAGQEKADVALPEGVRAVWDLDKAYRETTPTRERICINGLWRFRPAASDDEPVPPAGTGWGYFKVPGTWPLGAGRRETGPSQRIYAAEGWPDRLTDVDVAWYSREIKVPAQWQGRRIGIQAAWVNSYARVFVDGARVGDIVFPGGELDITAASKSGQPQQLAIQVFGRRLNADYTSFVTPAEGGAGRRGIGRRGLCGDVFLTSTSGAARIADVKVETSVRQWTLSIAATLEGLEPGKYYSLRARVTDKSEEVLAAESDRFTSDSLRNGRYVFSKGWKALKLWDMNTPQNQYDIAVELVQDGAVLDTYYPVRFGFREFWVEGRDFYLNGSRVHLRAEPLNSAQNDTATASYEGACETFKRLKWWGFNAAYTHNYGCSPGSHIAFEEILRAADDVGVALSFSLPQMRDYNWEGEKPEKRNGYERHVEYYARCAGNHPSVVMYSQNHNSLGYTDDENPQRIPLVLDGILPGDLREQIMRVYAREPILRQFDRVRPQYNHSGPSREMYTMNCYLNWTPMQERSEWFQPWSEYGARPLYLVEYGEPLYFSFGSNRGGQRAAGSRNVQQYYYTEWGSQIRGDATFELSEFEKAALRSEAARFRNEAAAGRARPGSGEDMRSDVPNLRGVQAQFIQGTWPYIRTVGLSGFNIWEESGLARLRRGVEAKAHDYVPDWEHLQRPGYSPDFCQPSASDSMPYSLGTRLEDWEPNVRGAALRRYNQPLLAYIAGERAHFTERSHNYLPGEVVEKQVVVLNDSREAVDCTCEWSANLPKGASGTSVVPVQPGRNERILVRFALPESDTAQTYKMQLRATFSTGEVQEDFFPFHVLAPVKVPRVKGRIALYDPQGETAKLLDELGLRFDTVQADADLSGYELSVIGKRALTVDGPAPDLSRVRDGLRGVIFEQEALPLERRLGFRVEEYGLRQVFARSLGHSILDGLSNDNLHDWRGEATLLPPSMPAGNVNSFPMIQWCGFTAPRPGRAGCRGNVSSVMIERPAAGDFLPLVQGGFALQYSPLMIYREGRGAVVFCQMDVTGRSEDEPTARRLVTNILEYADSYEPPPQRSAFYAGDPAGMEDLVKAGADVAVYGGQGLGDDRVMVLGPGAAARLGDSAGRVAAWVKGGGYALALGLSQEEASATLALPVRMEEKEHISCFFEPPAADTVLAGVGCGDVMTRDPRTVPLVASGAAVSGDGVLAVSEHGNVAFYQLPPWQFDYARFYNTKMAFQRSSFVVSRLLGNMGVRLRTPLLERFRSPLVLPPTPPKDVLGHIRIEQEDRAMYLPTEWKGLPLLSGGAPEGWTAPTFDDSKWRNIRAPGSWESQFEDLRNFDGVFLYRVKLTVPPEFVDGEATLVLGAVDDEDRTYVNGSLVGAINQQTNPNDYWEAARRYALAPGTLKAGENVIAVEVTDLRQTGGIMGFANIEDVPRVRTSHEDMRWLAGLYLDEPVSEDDPYRFYRW